MKFGMMGNYKHGAQVLN